MVRCLGYKNGINCIQTTKSPQKRENWERWQLCINCARKLHPEFYKDKKLHGYRKPDQLDTSASVFNGIEEIKI